MELVILINVVIGGYLLMMTYSLITIPKHVTYDSKHHFLSHFYMLLFILIGIDAHVFYHNMYPLTFAIFNILAHLVKENIRLFAKNRWTPDIKESI